MSWERASELLCRAASVMWLLLIVWLCVTTADMERATGMFPRIP